MIYIAIIIIIIINTYVDVEWGKNMNYYYCIYQPIFTTVLCEYTILVSLFLDLLIHLQFLL